MPKRSGVYPHKPTNTWYFKKRVTASDGTKRQVTRRGFLTAAEAKEARRTFVLEPEPSPTLELTVEQLITEDLDHAELHGDLGAKTLFDYRLYLRDYIAPHLGAIPAAALSPSDVKGWQATLLREGAVKSSRGLSPTTVRLSRAVLQRAFRNAVADGRLPTNPVSAVAPPRKPRRKAQYWTPEQAGEFLAIQEGDELWPLWATMLYLGVRIGELVPLRWANVDLQAKRLAIVDFVTVLGYEVMESPGKSAFSARTLMLDDSICRVLEQHRTAQAAKAVRRGHPVPELVFTNSAGERYHPQTISKRLAAEAKLSGLPRLTAHGLRHTCAVFMLAHGVHPKIAAERLGHASPTLFLTTYSHVTQGMHDDASRAIGEGLLRRFESPDDDGDDA